MPRSGSCACTTYLLTAFRIVYKICACVRSGIRHLWDTLGASYIEQILT